MASQLMSSVTNFALTIAVARAVSAEAFGEFALVFWTYLLLLNVGRAFGSHPLWVTASHVGGERWRHAQAGSAGFSMAAGGLIGGGLIVAGLVVGSQGLAFAALGLGLPGLLVQDAYRFGMIADGRARLSFGSDLTWAIVMGTLLAGVVLSGADASVPMLVAIWGAGALAGAIYAIWACGVLPEPTRARAWVTENIRLIPGFAVAGLAEPVANTTVHYILAAVAGLVTVAAIRAGQLLMSPITVAYQGLFAVLAPEASQSLRVDPGKLTRRMSFVAILLVVVALTYGIVALLLPDSIGEALLGDSWAYARPILVFLVVVVAAQGAAATASTGLLVQGAAKSMAKLALTTAPVTITLAVVGGAYGGTTGAAAGLAAGYLFTVCANWFVFLRVSRGAGSTDISATAAPELAAVVDEVVVSPPPASDPAGLPGSNPMMAEQGSWDHRDSDEKEGSRSST